VKAKHQVELEYYAPPQLLYKDTHF